MKKLKLLSSFILIIYFITFFYNVAKSEQNKFELKDSKIIYLDTGVIIPSFVQNGKFSTILLFDRSIEKVMINNNELDIIENGGYRISFFSLPLNYKKDYIILIIYKNGNLIEYKIPVVEKEPYPVSIIQLDNTKKAIVSKENTEVREKETKFFNDLLKTKSSLRYFTMPFQYPLKNVKIVSVFGNSRVYKDLQGNTLYTSTHLGVDLKASTGTEIFAVSTGKVAFAGYSITRGNCIYLDHGLGLFTSYFHLNKITVSEGQIVFTGDLIGYSGSTGISTGPHLHLGAILNSINLDPLSMIKEMNELDENYMIIESKIKN